jgi:serine/threonine-protein kinase
MSRDKLVALFWPDADADRGRHALTQALYASRRALGFDDVFLVSGDIRLNPQRIDSDVGDLADLLTVDDERAVALYRGPFLDGFYLPGASSFEQWSSAQRTRIDDTIVASLERLAAARVAGGHHAHASDWLKRAAAIRPLDSRLALKYMQTLAAAGDRGGAVRHAAIHTALLRNELELDPDVEVARFARSLRTASAWSGQSAAEPLTFVDATNSRWAPAEDEIEKASDASYALHDSIEVAPAVESEHSEANAVQTKTARPRRWIFLIAALSAIAVAGAFVIKQSPKTSPMFGRHMLQQKVVVAPFRVAAAAPTLAYLRDGMVELLSARLADDSSARSVDAGAVLGAWHAAGLAPAMDVPRDSVVSLAARLGAERVVVGGVIGTANHIVIRATALRVPLGTVAGQATVEGRSDSLTALIDRLAARLLVAEAGEDERLGSHITASLPALRSFLAGQAAFRHSDYSAAIRSYEAALQRDSTFALAALRLAIAADRIDDAQRGVQVAKNGLLPDLDLSARAAVLNRENTPAGHLTDDTLAYSAGVDLEIPLDRVSERNQYRRSLIQLERVQRTYDELRDQVSADAREAMRLIRSAQISLEIQRKGIELAKFRLDNAYELLRLGRKDNREVVDAQNALLRAQDAFEAARTSLQIQVLRFLRDTGTLRVDPDAGAIGAALDRKAVQRAAASANERSQRQ